MSFPFEGLISHYGAGLVGVVVGLEATGLPLPGESMMIAAALFCAATHRLSIGWVVAASVAGAVIGDNVGYLVGRTMGFRLLTKYGRVIGLTPDRLLLGRYLFARFGGLVVFAARFVAVLRTLAALLAGANQMAWRRFLIWNTLGGACWAVVYGLGAYSFGLEIQRLRGWIGGVVGISVICGVVLVVSYLKRHERRFVAEARADAGLQNQDT